MGKRKFSQISGEEATAPSSASTEPAPECTTEHVDVDAEIAAALARGDGEDVLELDGGDGAACSPDKCMIFLNLWPCI